MSDAEETPDSHPTDNNSQTSLPSGGSKERRKIEIKFIENKTRRHVTFSKRKHGIMKKAFELSVLTGTQVLLLVVSETGLVYTFSTPKFEPIVTQQEGRNLIQACLNAPDEQEEDANNNNTTGNIAAEANMLEENKQQQQQQQQIAADAQKNLAQHSLQQHALSNTQNNALSQQQQLLKQEYDSHSAANQQPQLYQNNQIPMHQHPSLVAAQNTHGLQQQQRPIQQSLPPLPQQQQPGHPQQQYSYINPDQNSVYQQYLQETQQQY